MHKQHSYSAGWVYPQRGTSRGPVSIMTDLLSYRKKSTPHAFQCAYCDLGYCLWAARWTQEFIRKTQICQELVLYHTKKRGKQLSIFTSFLPESTIFICFHRDPWKVTDKSNLSMLEQDGERDTHESAYARRNYFSPSLTFFAHQLNFILYCVYPRTYFLCSLLNIITSDTTRASLM